MITMAKCGQKSCRVISKFNLNTVLKVGRIIDDWINTFDFQNKSDIAVSDILSSIVSGLYESENQKN